MSAPLLFFLCLAALIDHCYALSFALFMASGFRMLTS